MGRRLGDELADFDRTVMVGEIVELESAARSDDQAQPCRGPQNPRPAGSVAAASIRAE
jgi:hypothetical protein